jgi:single-strand DNA-binding protein
MTTSSPLAGTNLAVLVGTLSRAPELRTLPSGSTLLALDLTVRAPDAAAESVPVAWPDPPAGATGWVAGDELLVVGRTRRRFFRAGGSTQSRTEVVAARVVPTRRGAAAGKALAAALAPLAAWSSG